MATRTWKVYGADGHRQAISFEPSFKWDFSENGKSRIIEVANADKTGTNDYSVVTITCDTFAECEEELRGQITDGLFENVRTGKVDEIFPDADDDVTGITVYMARTTFPGAYGPTEFYFSTKEAADAFIRGQYNGNVREVEDVAIDALPYEGCSWDEILYEME